jgi:hypothetical protein
MNKIIIEGEIGDEVYILHHIGKVTACFKDWPEMIAEGKNMEEAHNNLVNLLNDVLQYSYKNKN